MQKLELWEESMLCSGHAACPGCIDALSVRHVLAALGPKTMAIIPPSCMAIIDSDDQERGRIGQGP